MPTPLESASLEVLECYAAMFSADDDGDRQFMRSLKVIHRLRDLNALSPGGDAGEILAELARRRFGQEMPGGPPGPRPKRAGGRPPNWRVFGREREPLEFPGEVKASAGAAALRLADPQCPVTIWRWRDGAWKLYSHSEPAVIQTAGQRV